jgi:hypothetical protein
MHVRERATHGDIRRCGARAIGFHADASIAALQARASVAPDLTAPRRTFLVKLQFRRFARLTLPAQERTKNRATA